MQPTCRLLGGVASLAVLLASTAVLGQGPGHTIARDVHCLEASLGPLEEIDFESLPWDASSCSGVNPGGQLLENPLEISGVKFTDPACLATGFCSSPSCSWDADSTAPGNNVLMLNPGGRIDFLRGPGSAVLAVEGMGSSPFRVRTVDVLGRSVEASASGELCGVLFLAFTSRVGLSRVEIVEVGGNGGPLVLAAVFFRQTPWEAPPPDCSNPPPADHGRLQPRATGTVRFFPELGILDRAPIDTVIQPAYFKTTAENREFRRGFLEFAVPEVEGEILAAALIVPESKMVFTSQTLPPDRYEISYYPADLAVTGDDFGRSKVLLDSFETDPSRPSEELAFVVTSQVREFRGKNLGFEIKLALDPLEDENGSHGRSSFGSFCSAAPFLEIITREIFFLRGDPSADGRVDLSDPIAILQALFGGETDLGCEKSADVDDTGVLDLTDAVYLLQFQFLGGPPPKGPFPSCGTDATPDDLGCGSVPPCP